MNGNGVVLRDYQQDLVGRTRAALANKNNKKKVLMQAPTGAGKTAMATFMVAGSARKQVRCWFIVHREELVFQTSKTFEKYGVPHSFIAAGRPYDATALVNICSIDTLKNRLKLMPKEQHPQLVLWDECHHIGAAGWAAVMEQLEGAYQVGLSATPQRLDGTGLDKHFNELVPGPSVEWLIENSHLSPYRVFAPSAPDLFGVHTLAGDFKQNELSDAMDKPKLTGDAVEHWKRLAAGLRTVVFAVTVKHSEAVAQAFNEAGVPAAHLDGGTPKADRAEIIRKFADGEILVLTNVALFGEGFDLSAIAGRDVTIDCCVLLRPTQSLSLYLQQVGRALRPGPGKTAIILDHAGNSARHGLPDDPRAWTLTGRAKGKSHDLDDGPPPPVTCAGCFSQIKRPCPSLCPYCQHPLSVPVELPKFSKEELKEVSRKAREEAKAAKEAEKLAKEAAKEAERLERAARKAAEKIEREKQKAAARREAVSLNFQRKREDRACTTLEEMHALGKKRGYDFPHHWAERRFNQLNTWR